MIKKIYNPKKIEQSLYGFWEEMDCFKPNWNIQNGNYCITIPPPNITGYLHMGHAFQQTIMDILVRYQRMQGKNTLWQVGTDHAGIAAQIVVEKKIFLEEKKTIQALGREAFVQKMWEWKKNCGNIINTQMRRLGNSVDWSRERFTLDQEMSETVREVFIRLYKERLIYRGKRLVNWDVYLGTAISDLEVENREKKGSIWYIRYPLEENVTTRDGSGYLLVSTTRPETMFGDVGIAVHPNDSRYRHLIGKQVLLPLTDYQIPIIGDERVSPDKGTGCMKVTPAHDFKDYEIGKSHRLPIISTFALDGKIKENAEIFIESEGRWRIESFRKIPIFFRGLERLHARKFFKHFLDREGFLESIEDHASMIPYGIRSGSIIEPMITDQWYIKIHSLAKSAIEAVQTNKIQFISKQYRDMYFNWLYNAQDWCISRQIWWGHRIPAWYDSKNRIYVGHDEREIRKEYKIESDVPLTQDEDVLDTWFSSALWTISTLGWPKNTKELQVFHPTSVIVSGFDIIFFWIARMIMLTMHLLKTDQNVRKIPFNLIYITGLIRDEMGEKMSKSKGNVIDPMDIIDGISLRDLLKKRTENMLDPRIAEKIKVNTKKYFPNGIKSYGTDALRFTLTILSSAGRDIKWDMNRLEGYRNFCNKLWNASRFILQHAKYKKLNFSKECIVSLPDRWIVSELHKTIKIFRNALDKFQFHSAANILYRFVWDQFCNWYLESIKPFLRRRNDEELRMVKTAVIVLESILRLSHPIIPFITEKIWQKLKKLFHLDGLTIMLEPFPTYNEKLVDQKAMIDMEWIKKVVISIRSIRKILDIKQNEPISLFLRNAKEEVVQRIHNNMYLISSFLRLEKIIFLSNTEIIPNTLNEIIEGTEFLVPMHQMMNKERKLEKVSQELLKVEKEILRIENRLNNSKFMMHAPKRAIEKMKRNIERFKQKKKSLSFQKHAFEKR